MEVPKKYQYNKLNKYNLSIDIFLDTIDLIFRRWNWKHEPLQRLYKDGLIG